MKRYLSILLLSVLAAAGCQNPWYEMPSKQVTEIIMDTPEVSVRVDETWPLKVSFGPAGASSVVEWRSSAENIATVSVVGTITGIKEGTATITATSATNPEASATCTVTVLPPKEPDVPVSAISLKETSYELEKGSTVDLSSNITVLPANATNKQVSYSSSNTAVAFCNPYGLVTAMGSGNAVITITAADGSGVTARCGITVPEQETPPGPDPGGDPPADADLIMFDSCDNLDYFTGNATHRTGVTVETVGRVEGKGYVQRISGSDAEIFIFNRGKDVIDAQVTDPDKALLTFWFYIDDAAKLRSKAAKGGRIEISHSGSPSRQCLYWDSKKYIADMVMDGWNYISLPFKEATEMTPDNPFNPKGANYFRIYFDGAAASTEFVYGIDAIGFKHLK